VAESEIADSGPIQASYLQTGAVELSGLGSGGDENGGESQNLRRPHDDRVSGKLARGLPGGALPDQAAFVEHEDAIGVGDHRVGALPCDQYAPALRRIRPEQRGQPAQPLGLESVIRLVEQQRLWVAEKCLGEGEAHGHALGELGDPGTRLVGEAAHVEDGRDPLASPAGSRAGVGGQRQLEMPGHRSSRVHGERVEQDADRAHRMRQRAELPSAVESAAPAGVELEHAAQHGGLAGSRRPEQPGYLARADLEAGRVKHPPSVPPRRELDRLDHTNIVAARHHGKEFGHARTPADSPPRAPQGLTGRQDQPVNIGRPT